ncbi:MAG: DUF433 domain-containing protein [Chloroflexia bacterium]|nr:DUF433 domain-containing protein [Chloroflexia bacterium]
MNNRLITVDPAMMMGKPIITGTRITVESLLDALRRARRSTRWRDFFRLSASPNLSRSTTLPAAQMRHGVRLALRVLLESAQT